jgi:hypothetical protein
MVERKLLASTPGPCVNLRKVRRAILRNRQTARQEHFRAFGVPSRAEQSDGIGLCQAPPTAPLPVMLRLSCPAAPLLGDPP